MICIISDMFQELVSNHFLEYPCFIDALDFETGSLVSLISNYLNWKILFGDRLTCIYAACKAEENHVSAEELGKAIEQDHQMILNNEMIVLQA